MAIEGNDWWAIAGAAAGGLVAGIVGTKLVSPKEPVFTGIRRWYEVPSTEDVRDRAAATIWHTDDGYWLRVYTVQMPSGSHLRDETHLFSMIEEGITPAVEKRNIKDLEEAIKKADQVTESLDMAPITDWGYPSPEKIEVWS